MILDYQFAVPDGLAPRRCQIEAFEALQKSDAISPLVHMVMGSGKSILIVMVVRSLLFGSNYQICIAVPTEALVEQLYGDLTQHIGERFIGRYYGKIKTPGKKVVVTCFPSMSDMASAYSCHWDALIIDECHLSQAPSILEAVALLSPVWRLGLSATPYRSDDKFLSLWDSVAYSYGIAEALEDNILVPWEIVHPERGNVDLDEICLEMLQANMPTGPGIVGAKSILDAEEFAEVLSRAGIPALPVHSQLSRAEYSRRIERLRIGEMKAIVHVDMLTTGVNLPWLQWLMLRRQYNSRTSFLQFFGRGLRSSPGKDKIIVFDPWFQLEKFSLEYAARIGQENPKSRPKADIQPPTDEVDFTLIDLPPFDGSLTIPHLTAKRAASAWCRLILQAAQASGIAGATAWNADLDWRKKPGSTKQLQSLSKNSWATRHLPKGYIRDGVKKLLENMGQLTSGACSDILEVLTAGSRKGAPYRRIHHHWEWSSVIDVPPLPQRVVKSLKPTD